MEVVSIVSQKGYWGPKPVHDGEGKGVGGSRNALGSQVGRIWGPVREGDHHRARGRNPELLPGF